MLAAGNEAGDELVDIVDEADNVVAVVTRREMRADLLRHRAVYIAVQGSDGRLLVHQRSFDKDVRPGAWDIAFGGVVGSGEGYDRSAQRELAEEIGILDAVLTPIGGGSFADEHYTLIGRCYHVVHDGPFHFADGEVIGTRWVNASELADLIATGNVLADSVALLIGRLDVAA